MPVPDDSHVVRHSGNVAGLRLTLGICLCYTLCVACLRGYIRWRAFGRDDLVVLVATAVFLAFIGIGYALATAGLGLPLNEVDLRQPHLQTLDRLILASNLSWAIGLCLSKVAIVSTLLRTTQTESHRRAQYATAGLVVAQGIVAIALLTAHCSPGPQLYWNFQIDQSTCLAKDARWLVITILDVITEIVLLCLPVHLVWSLKMSIRNKFIVISAFWLRFPALIFTVMRHQATHRLTKTSDVSRTAAIVLIWQAVELSYALVAVTIAALKRFTESLNTGFGHGELIRVHGSSYKMSAGSGSAKNSKSSKSRPSHYKRGNVQIDTLTTDVSEQELAPSRKAQPGTMKLRPEHLRNTTKITSTNKRPRSTICTRKTSSDGSEDGIIRQQVQYSVQYGEDGGTRPGNT